jgi:membrane-associated phospholipid phosphatase
VGIGTFLSGDKFMGLSRRSMVRIRKTALDVKRASPRKGFAPIPLLVDLLAALAGLAVAVLAAEWYVRSSAAPARPALATARAVGEAVRPHPALRRLLVRRLDRGVASGFLLTLALICALGGGVLLGVLFYMVRGVPALQHVDNSVADWAYASRTPFSTSGLRMITQLGNIRLVAGLAIVLAAVDVYRSRSHWSLTFLVTVVVGMEFLSTAVKDLAERVRPALVPAAASLGPSFPSGHSATAAAFFAAAALILGRALRPHPRHILIGIAVAIAVAVAASRVLLDLHWLSDVIGGLALGWGWFGLCAAVFGGRLLRPTAAVDVAAAEAAAPQRSRSTTRLQRS